MITHTLTFPSTRQESLIFAPCTTIYRYQKQFRLRDLNPEPNIGGVQIQIKPAPPNQIITRINPQHIPSDHLLPFTNIVEEVATKGIYGHKPFTGIDITLKQSWEDPSQPPTKHQHIWRRAIVDSLSAYQMDGVKFPHWPLPPPTENPIPIPLSERLVISYDVIDQSPAAESVGGICLLCHPFKQFHHEARPDIKHWFIELISGNEWRNPWAITVYETMKQEIKQYAFPPCTIVMFNMIKHPTDSNEKAYQLATKGAFNICLPIFLEQNK